MPSNEVPPTLWLLDEPPEAREITCVCPSPDTVEPVSLTPADAELAPLVMECVCAAPAELKTPLAVWLPSVVDPEVAEVTTCVWLAV